MSKKTKRRRRLQIEIAIGIVQAFTLATMAATGSSLVAVTVLAVMSTATHLARNVIYRALQQ